MNMTEIIIDMETMFEKGDFKDVVKLYEANSEDSFRSNIANASDLLNFMDMILISYIECGYYKKAELLVSTQLEKVLLLKETRQIELTGRIKFYLQQMIKIAGSNNQHVFAYMLISEYNTLYNNDESYKRDKLILLKYVLDIGNGIIGVPFILTSLSLVFLKYWGYEFGGISATVLLVIYFCYLFWGHKLLKDLPANIAVMCYKFFCNRKGNRNLAIIKELMGFVILSKLV